MKKKSGAEKELLKKEIIIACVVLSVLAAIGLIWQYLPLSDYVTPEKVTERIRWFKDDPWAPIIMIGLFVIGGICFFPLTVLTVATAMTFGPIQGIFISLTGSISSAIVVYWIGYFLGKGRIRKWMGPLCDNLQRLIENTGVIGMMVLRLVLVTPYTMGNMAFGILAVHFPTFVAGSFLALIPGAIIRSILGNAIMDFWTQPDTKNMTYIAAGIVGWLAIVALSHFFARKWGGGRLRH